jgi:tripartite-type tricarboxylate transporter receptor subunit TctC
MMETINFSVKLDSPLLSIPDISVSRKPRRDRVVLHTIRRVASADSMEIERLVENTMRRFGLPLLSFTTAAVLAAVTPSVVAAQSWPARPVTIVVPYPAGIAPDIVGRFLAQELGDKLGQRFLVDNRTGASGDIGAMAVARAAPDGHTILLATPYPIGLNKLMSPDLKFDPEKDFTPIVLIAKSPHIIVAGAGSPAKDLKALIAHAKANPGKLNAGIPGTGTTAHIALEALLNLSGTSMTMVPYRGSPPVSDLVGAQIDVGVGLVPSYVSMVNAGQLRGLAVTSSKRSEQLPDVPTAEKAGFPGFEATAWYVLAAPAGTPPDIIQKINSVVNDYIRSEKGKQQFYTLDMQAAGGTPAEAMAFIASEMVKWGPVIKKANIKM